MPKTPSYRKRPGRDQALVTLTDSATKRRKDFWLGKYGSAESREMYHRVIAAWETRGRRWPELDSDRVSATADGLSVNEVVDDYWHWAKAYYSDCHLRSIRYAIRILRQFYGTTSADEFGPNKLRSLREEMIRGSLFGDRPRRPWSRTCTNMAVQRIRHVFKWATARELVPASVHESLRALEPLRRGRCAAHETDRVTPVPQALLDGVLPHLSTPVRALVELQLLSGARSAELLGLRPADIQMDDKTGVWTFRPEHHKNAYRDRERTIYFGPKAQDVLRPFMTGRATTAYLFSPTEAEAERRKTQHENRVTPLSCGNRPGTNRAENPVRTAGDRYTTASYRRAIQYACDRAFPPTGKLARHKGETKRVWLVRLNRARLIEELKAWRKAHRWHPHQLRHNAATQLRREFGLEAAQLALGHASAQITDAVYAERDRAKVIEIMRRIG